MTEDRTSPRTVDLESLEIDLLTEAIFQAYGFDFRRYSRASLRRRLRRRMEVEGVATISALQDRVLHDRACMSRLFADLSVHVSSMFRDPGFYQAFREKVVPLLRTYPFVRIWNAGCAGGEETYSLAILLRETGLYERALFYGSLITFGVLGLGSKESLASTDYGSRYEQLDDTQRLYRKVR